MKCVLFSIAIDSDHEIKYIRPGDVYQKYKKILIKHCSHLIPFVMKWKMTFFSFLMNILGIQIQPLNESPPLNQKEQTNIK